MVKSNAKGAKGERDWAEFCGGERISRRGLPGPDVQDNLGRLWEVKWVGKFQSVLRSWLNQTKGEGALGLAFRENRGEWWIAVPASTAKELGWFDAND